MSIELTKEQAQKLGFKSSVQVGEDLGFTDFQKSSAFILEDTFLDLENLGRLKEANPRVVVRKPIEEFNTSTSDSKTWQTWRQVIEDEHFYSKYQFKTVLLGQLGEIHFTKDFYSYKDNNFFRPFNETKIVKRVKEFNNFKYARFRFPKYASNTIDININTKAGQQVLRPKFAGILSKEEERKNYYRWHPASTRFQSGQQQSPYDNLNLSGYNIPYPNTLCVYNSAAFNIPVKLATKFNDNNSQQLEGLIVISTGDAEQKTICYVSPHTIGTGYLNTIEDIYTESSSYVKTTSPGSNELATILNSSWYGSSATGYIGCNQFGYFDNLNGSYKECSIPSQNTKYKRFSKIGEPNKQIYFDHTLPTPYGSGRWCIALSGSSNLKINTGQSAVVYIHQPNSITDWQKTDPRKLSGPWVVASGHSKAANSTFLNRAAFSKPTVSPWQTCRKNKSIKSLRLQMPSLIPDSKYLNSGYVLPEGIKLTPYTFLGSMYPEWKTSYLITGTAPNTGILNNPTGNQYSGYVINNNLVSYSQILQSGIQIPQMAYSGLRWGISSTGHFQQTIPLKDTYFYKFYNQLYQENNKTIATGTWNGIIPSGVRFSVELISTTLEDYVGIADDKNISVIYSGYGNGDSIDNALQTGISKNGAHTIFPNPSEKYMVSGKVPWHQKRYPYRHAFNEFNELVYTAFESGPTSTDAKNIARAKAVSTVNSKILQLVNKIFPNLTHKNKKWKSLQRFKETLKSKKLDQFARVYIPETAEPGKEIQKRLRPYSATPIVPHTLSSNFQQP